MLLEGIGDLAISWRIKGSSSIILSQVKSIGLSCLYHISNVPPCGNMCSTYLHWKLLAPLHMLVLYLAYVCICCALLYDGLHTMYMCSCVEPLLHLMCILFCYFERLMVHPILGEWCPLGTHNPIMCVHEEYHLVLILRLSSLYVVCMLMRNSNSIMSINYLLLVLCCLFWK